MPAEVGVPVLGESIVDATVGAWLKHEGEQVEAGEALVQLETEKVNVDVAADQAGVLGQITAREGQTVHPGDVLATINEGTGAPAAPAQFATDTTTAPSDSAAAPPSAPDEIDRPHASPVARRMAEEHGLDLASVEGTGTGGRVTREDVERAIGPARESAPLAASPTPAPPSTDGQRGETHIRMSRRRQTIASRL